MTTIEKDQRYQIFLWEEEVTAVSEVDPCGKFAARKDNGELVLIHVNNVKPEPKYPHVIIPVYRDGTAFSYYWREGWKFPGAAVGVIELHSDGNVELHAGPTL